MGLFGTNWARELERAEEFLARDVPVAALEIAERAERKADPDSRAQAAGLVLRARQAVLTSVLAKADAAEAAGDLEDAADWLRSAIEREPSAVRQAELEGRIRALLDRSFDRENPWDGGEVVVTVVADETVPGSDLAPQYETLISMLSDEVRALYEGRPVDFQRAVVELHEGQAAQALEVLAAFAQAAPDDGIAHLELGRARLFLGEADAARGDFAVAWRALGDEALNAGGSLLMPALWAEAALAAGEATEVVERLEPLASSEIGHPDVCRLYATALMAAGRAEVAVGYLEETVPLLDRDPELDLLFAQALAATGDLSRARAGLERAIDPSCGAGCASKAAHLPSFRMLARLQLLEGGNPERARELMAWVAKTQRGYLGAEDHEILAGYYGAIGDHQAAADAAGEAARLAGLGDAAGSSIEPDSMASRGSVL